MACNFNYFCVLIFNWIFWLNKIYPFYLTGNRSLFDIWAWQGMLLSWIAPLLLLSTVWFEHLNCFIPVFNIIIFCCCAQLAHFYYDLLLIFQPEEVKFVVPLLDVDLNKLVHACPWKQEQKIYLQVLLSSLGNVSHNLF